MKEAADKRICRQSCQGCVALRTGENVRASRELLSSDANSLLSKEELSNEEICLRDHNIIKVSKAAVLLDSNWNSGGAIGKILLDYLEAFL